MTLTEYLISQQEWTHGMLDMFTAGVEEDQWLTPPVSGGNHLWWLLGHLGYNPTGILELCTGKTRQEDPWSPLFSNGTKPHPEGAGYPTPAEIRVESATRWAELADFITTCGDEGLQTALPREIPSAPFLKTYQDAISLYLADRHMHMGQILVLRKIAGLPSPFRG